MKPSLRIKLDQLSARRAELDALLASEEATRDMERYRSLTRERAEIDPVVERFGEYEKAEADLATAVELAHDPQMRDFAEEERRAAEGRLATLRGELQAMLLPKDPNDERSVFIEIRAGTGGDESALFAADLFRMFSSPERTDRPSAVTRAIRAVRPTGASSRRRASRREGRRRLAAPR